MDLSHNFSEIEWEGTKARGGGGNTHVYCHTGMCHFEDPLFQLQKSHLWFMKFLQSHPKSLFSTL